jgi:hypothetical protein
MTRTWRHSLSTVQPWSRSYRRESVRAAAGSDDRQVSTHRCGQANGHVERHQAPHRHTPTQTDPPTQPSAFTALPGHWAFSGLLPSDGTAMSESPRAFPSHVSSAPPRANAPTRPCSPWWKCSMLPEDMATTCPMANTPTLTQPLRIDALIARSLSRTFCSASYHPMTPFSYLSIRLSHSVRVPPPIPIPFIISNT